jgi:hypothetical protein
VTVNENPWSDIQGIIPLWPENKRRNNQLGSLLVVFALLVEDMFKTMADLSKAVLSSFEDLPEATFKHQVYLRTLFARHLHRLNEYEQQQWLKPEEVLSEIKT